MEENKKDLTALKDKLFFKAANVFDKLDETETEKMFDYAKGYARFIDAAKTEREAVNEAVKSAKEKGFVEYKLGDKVEAGGKYYMNNRGKALYIFRVGTEDIKNGIRIAAAHIDSPRIDLKQHPLYEDSGMCFFKTHYYGGIKKYQWTTIPLAIHGTVVRSDGSSVDFRIGESEDDPIFYINDLLIHLAKDQMYKPLAEGITGEQLNILLGSRPYPGSSESDGDRVKLNVMAYLNEKYDITEADLMSAELTMVPADKARDIGFDRSLIGAYGHDDRVCAYPELTALLDCEDTTHTIMSVLADKEETGSEGVTGMQSRAFTDIIDALAAQNGTTGAIVRAASKCLSADVNAAFDPNFGDVFEKRNSSVINGGVVMTKYTGSRGKSGTSDATGEFVAEIRAIFDSANVIWQTGELGKVDQGGGGTVAQYIAAHNIDTVDLGVPVISMHAPYEVIAKTDLYMTYKAIAAFFA